MAAFNFPNSPSTNDIHNENGVSFKWNGTVWKKIGTVANQLAQLGVTGISTLTGGINVGTAGTISSVGNLTFDKPGAGIITATKYYGDGSSLSNVTSTTINNNADNRIITGSGTANTLNGEANLTFDGNNLTLAATKYIYLGSTNQFVTGDGSGNVQFRTNSGQAIVEGSTSVRLQGGSSGLLGVRVAGSAGAAQLYYSQNEKLITMDSGVKVTGITSTTNLNVTGISTFGGTLKIPTVAGTNTNSNLNVLFQTATGVIDGGSGLQYNPSQDVLTVNGNFINANTFRGDGDLGTLTCDNHSSTTFVKVSSKVDIGLKDNTAGAFNIKEGSNEYITVDTTNSSEAIKFGTAGTERLRITSAGFVGIGEDVPDLKLHVNGTNALPATTGTTAAGHLILRNKAGSASHGMYLGVSNASPWGSWVQAQDASALGTSYPLLLNPNGGRVGIGTVNPGTRDAGSLDIQANLSNNGPYFRVLNTQSTYGGGIQQMNNNARGGLQFLNASGTSVGHFYHSTGGWTWSENLQVLGGAGIRIGTTSGNDLLEIKQDDAVGPTIVLENNSNKAYINNWGSTGGGSGRTNRFELNATAQAQASYCAPYHTFMVGGVGDSNEKLRIASTGQLQVLGTSSNDPLLVRGGTEGNASIRLEGGNSGADNSRIEAKYNLALACNADGNQSSRNIKFYNSTTALISINPDGQLKLRDLSTTAINALTGVEGSLVYDTTLNVGKLYNGSSWLVFGGSVPQWQTAAGNISTIYNKSLTTYSISNLSATGGSVTYAVTSGSLPGGMSLSSAGAFSGNVNLVGSDTTFTFTVTATNANGTSDRQFNIIVKASVSETYSFSGSTVTWNRPHANVKLIEFKMWGGAGSQGTCSSNSNHAGAGGMATGQINTASRAQLYLQVGEAGESISSGNSAGGWPNGGEGNDEHSCKGGGGGGSSNIYNESGTGSYNNLLAVAGAGGGVSHGNPNSNGGDGGGTNGTSSNRGGNGGSQNGGGNPAGPACGNNSNAGSKMQGGNAGTGSGCTNAGAGGGGGWYGGGAGGNSNSGNSYGGGGGGSGYYDSSNVSSASLKSYGESGWGGDKPSSVAVRPSSTDNERGGHGYIILWY